MTLALEGIAKRFGSTDALTEASLTVRAGTIHALLGENGAGKTTLMRVAYGLVQPDRGTIRLGDGRVLELAGPATAIRAGIGMVHQHFTIVHAMTVAENVALGGRGTFDRDVTARRVGEIAREIGAAIDPHAHAGALGVPAQQQLEIIKALSRDARLLILDEPTAVLAPMEAERLLGQLRKLADGGLSIVLITHKLREALAVADDVTVLRQGATVLSTRASAVTETELAAAMVGHGSAVFRAVGASGGRPATPRASGRAPVTRARALSAADARGVVRVRGVDLELYPGEIVGIAGVEGSGVRELLRAIAGRTGIVSGTLENASLVGFVPEDRHHDGIALDFSLTENVALRGAGTRRGLAHWRAFRKRTQALIESFDIRGPGVDAPVRVLSGGNQQKLVLAREMEGSPTLLVAENPTRSLDLRATSAVHAKLREARDSGMAIVFYSSDLDELIQLSDRIYAMFGGELTSVPCDRNAIGRAMLGAAVASVDPLAPDRST